MIKTTKYLLIFLFLVSISGIQNCEFLENVCEYTRTINVPVKLREHFITSNVTDWGSFPKDIEFPELGHDRNIRLWFPKEKYDGLSINDVCALAPFSASLKITYDPDSPIAEDFNTKYKLICYYPSIPPSGKILHLEGNVGTAAFSRDDAVASEIVSILPNPGAKNIEATWMFFGVEIEFLGHDPDYREDLKSFRAHHLYAILDVEYFYF